MTRPTDTSRRNFLRTAATAAAGASVLAGCGSDSSAAPAASFWLPTKWDGESDLVVLGFGAAGASAAYHAAKAGAAVTVLDASATGGGDTASSGGFVFFGGGTALQAAAGVSETPDQMYASIRAMGGDSADPDLQKVWCQRNKEAYDFLVACGESWSTSDMFCTGMEEHQQFQSLAPNGTPVKHALVDAKAGAGLFAKISAKVLATSGVTLKGQLKATRLVQDPQTRRVLGVVAKATQANGSIADGTPEQFFKARKAVLIATGAFSQDKEMMQRHSADLSRLTHVASKNADGSGIKLGQSLGGDVRQMRTFWGYCGVAGTPEFSKSVLVNTQGFRFVPEDAIPYWVGYYMVRHHPLAFSIADASVYPVKPANAYQGATIAELVAAINAGEGTTLSAAVVQGTIDGYNATAKADGTTGSDPAFLKAAKYVLPIATAPFYALKVASTDAFGTTTGGLRINTKAQLLDAAGAVIPNVYAAGTCAGGAPSEVYTGSGTAISSCLTFGKVAAENAVAETAW
jgi:3-oxo-5alpha-steroid 4-dehydrogenase